MFSIKYRFDLYLDSYACYLDFELLSPSEEVEIPESIQILNALSSSTSPESHALEQFLYHWRKPLHLQQFCQMNIFQS